MIDTALLSGTGAVQARVLCARGRDLLLEGEAGALEARLAFSCLVQPEPGDLALCLPGPDGRLHLVAILERPGAQALSLAFPGEATLRSDGNLLVSGRSLTLAAQERLDAVCDSAYQRSRESVVESGRIRVLADSLETHAETSTLVGRRSSTLVRDLVHQARTYLRRSETLDQVEGGRLMRRCKGLYALNATHTVLLSSGDTRIDGAHIHMG